MPDGSSDAIRRGRKFDQVLEGAKEVFLTDGFEGASVDDIARKAGVSKATLYSYFPDKRMLFMEVAKVECRRQADQAIEKIDMSAPVDVILREAATQVLAFISSDFWQRIFRICVGESDRFPALGAEFYQSGPALIRARLVAFFREAVERGELVIEDFDLAANQFHALCKADVLERLVFQVDKTIPESQRIKVIDGAVAIFMARYGPRS